MGHGVERQELHPDLGGVVMRNIAFEALRSIGISLIIVGVVLLGYVWWVA